MTTVVEALFITLGLDTRDFDKKKEGVTTSLIKLGETSDKQTKAIAESGKKAANAFTMLKVEVLGALAAFGMTTSFKDFVTTNMNGQAALGRLSTNLGMSTQKLEAWKLAAKEMGQSGEDAVGALQSVAKGVAEARITGHSALTDASRRFSFKIDPKDNEQTLINISRRMAQTHDRQQAMMIAEAAGVGNISNLLLQGPDKLQAQLAHTMSLTGAATKESTEQAARLQAQWADLQERFQQVGERVFARLEPVLARLGERLANWLDSIDWQKVIDSISRFIDKVNEVVKAMGGWKTIIEVLGGVLALKLLSPLFGLVTVFSRLIPLIGSASIAAKGMAGAFSAIAPAVYLASSAFAGWKLGEWIAANMSPEQREKVGLFVTTILALTGNETARDVVNDEKRRKAIDRAMEDENIPEELKKAAAGKMDLNDPAVIKLLSASYRAQLHEAEAAGGTEKNIGDEPAGIRRNNPGNIKWGDNFAVYKTPQEGLNALAWQLHLYYSGKSQAAGHRKLDTLQDIVSTYAPKNENDTAAYIANAAKWMHVKPGDHLDLSDPAVMSSLMKAMIKQENGKNPYSDAMIGSAAAKYARSVPLSPQTPAMSTAQRSGGNTDNSSSVSIGTLNVNAPKATDANGVAKGMQSALRTNSLVNPFTKGLT